MFFGKAIMTEVAVKPRRRWALILLAGGIVALAVWAAFERFIVGRHPLSSVMLWEQRKAPAQMDLFELFEDAGAVEITWHGAHAGPVVRRIDRGTPDFDTVRESLKERMRLVTDYQQVRKFCHHRRAFVTIESTEAHCTVFPRHCVETKEGSRTAYYIAKPDLYDRLVALGEGIRTD